jgi:hypothetical protein
MSGSMPNLSSFNGPVRMPRMSDSMMDTGHMVNSQLELDIPMFVEGPMRSNTPSKPHSLTPPDLVQIVYRITWPVAFSSHSTL